MCSTIITINLQNNLIDEGENLIFLSFMQNLKYLNIDNNPLSENDQFSVLLKNYLPNVLLIK